MASIADREVGAHLSPMTRHLPGLARSAARASAAARSARALQRAADLAPTIAAWRAAGTVSLRALATRLNEAGIAPPRGTIWWPTTVGRELARIEEQDRY